ncbi:MAG: hypothetical protein HYY16_19070 [Planctomycetes bacterium]|nr:hypothetical protein [Planctomycetota bacterium]
MTNEDNDVTRPPEIGLSVASLAFSAAEGGTNPSAQTVTLTNTGGLPLDWSVSSGDTWLNVGPTSGVLSPTAMEMLTASVDISALSAGTYTTAIIVSAVTASNSPQTISVTLTVTPPAPAVAITGPTSAPTFTTAASSVILDGTTTNAATSVTWANAATGDSDVAVGTDSWTATVPLIAGDNIITVYGWNAGGVGTDEITVTYAAETTPPVVTTPSPSYVSASASFALDGTASDASGIASVMWENVTTGTSGTAIGTTSWSASIPLTAGRNVVVVTATDGVGNRGSTTVDIDFTSPVDIVSPAILVTAPTTDPTYTSSVSPVLLAGIASDNVGVAGVSWTNEGTGGRAYATGTTAWSAPVPLASGSNVIRVIATDPSGNTATALLFVTFRPPTGDTQSPILSVTSPMSASYFLVPSSDLALGGTAADNIAIRSVVWSNAATGQSGSADGLAFWSADVALLEGPNPITFEAFDTSGNSSTTTVLVEHRIPPPPPNTVKVGHCGSVGLDLLLPLGLLLLARAAVRRRFLSRQRRKPHLPETVVERERFL